MQMVNNIEQHEPQRTPVEAARQGVNHATDDLVCHYFNEACEHLGTNYNTLKKRIAEGTLQSVNGRITGMEIRRYLALS